MFFIGMALVVIGGLWVVVQAFGESIIWGLACLFIPFVSLFYVFTRWSTAKAPFFVALAGVACLFFAK